MKHRGDKSDGFERSKRRLSIRRSSDNDPYARTISVQMVAGESGVPGGELNIVVDLYSDATNCRPMPHTAGISLRPDEARALRDAINEFLEEGYPLKNWEAR